MKPFLRWKEIRFQAALPGIGVPDSAFGIRVFRAIRGRIDCMHRSEGKAVDAGPES